MFGADTPLVMDALQLAAFAAVAGGAAVILLMRGRKRASQPPSRETRSSDLEGRVRVLERIATDRSIDLADEIEALRDGQKPKQAGGASQ